MKNLNTKLVFILDRSGSMTGLEKSTIDGFNSMIKEQKSVGGKCLVSAVLFNHESKRLFEDLPIERVRSLTHRDYIPSGCTALLDAVGEQVSKAKRQQEFYGKTETKVIFVIITDGEENASREYSYSQVKKMIKSCQDKYGWDFIFLGANLDAAEAAADLGIREDYAADYVADEVGTDLSYKAVSETLCSIRCEMAAPSVALDRVRNDAKKRRHK